MSLLCYSSLLVNTVRMWRNWYTRTFEGRVALPCEFESRHPHFQSKSDQLFTGHFLIGANDGGMRGCGDEGMRG